MDYDCYKYSREFIASVTFSCKCVYFFSLEQSDINTLDTAIKRNSKYRSRDKLGHSFAKLIWYSNLSSNEQRRINPMYFTILSVLLVKTNIFFFFFLETFDVLKVIYEL